MSTLKIIFVDDEPLIGEVLSNLIEGYREKNPGHYNKPRVFEDSESVKNYIEKEGVVPDVVILDRCLKDGVEESKQVYEYLRQKNPNIYVICLTGYWCEDKKCPDECDRNAKIVLYKPIDYSENVLEFFKHIYDWLY